MVTEVAALATPHTAPPAASVITSFRETRVLAGIVYVSRILFAAPIRPCKGSP